MQMGASYLGLLAWIFGSLGTVVLIAYGSVFGELFHSEPAAQPPGEDVEGAATRAWKRILYPLGGVVSGAFLSGLVLFAVSQGVAVVAPEVQTGGDRGKYDLYQIGTYLSADPMISVFSIGMLFVIALFGLGVVTRPRRLKSSSSMSQAQETP